MPLFTGGCTYALWQPNRLDAFNQPAPTPHLQLFNAVKNQDLLVVYDEFSERSGSTTPRAYFLYKNNRRIDSQRSPIFVSTNLALNLPPVPVYENPPLPDTNSPDQLYAVQGTNFDTFTIYSGQRMVSSHGLPYYSDGVGDFERVLLTPFAVAVDVTIIGGVIFVVGWADSETEPDYDWSSRKSHHK